MQYVDSSALLKRYLREPDSSTAQRMLLADAGWVTAAHTEVEIRRALAVRLGDEPDLHRTALHAFELDWERCAVVQLDAETCRRAADLVELTRVRTLDALHLAAAQRAGAPALRVLTFDVRLASAARALGWAVVGA